MIGAQEKAPSTSGTRGVEITQSGIVADDKVFRDLQAQFALRGHELVRINPGDGKSGMYATRWGLVRHLADINAARAFLSTIGGAP